jgi:MFS transporter, BCD family, chlorophyll transporter
MATMLRGAVGAVLRFVALVRAWLERHPRVRRGLAIFRLGLFQFGMGVSLAPITGTLNRVLVSELQIPAVAVGVLIAIHYFVSPVRALIGFRTDEQRAQGHWRTPYLVLGMMLTYGGLACAPFALILLSGDGSMPFWVAFLVCFLIFGVYGIGVNIAETAYLAIVRDVTPPKERGLVLASLWTMLILGMIVGAVVIGLLLQDYSHFLLIRVMQGSAVVFLFLAIVAMIGQERLQPNGRLVTPVGGEYVRAPLQQQLRLLGSQRTLRGLFLVLFLATAAFACHDVLLEPYGGEVLGLSVTATTELTALWGVAMLCGVAGAGYLIWKRTAPLALIASGCTGAGLGFMVISVASDQTLLGPFCAGVALIGAGRGMFLVGSIALVMALSDAAHAGLFLGLWGVMQALAQGLGTIVSGLTRDLVNASLGGVAHGYTVVWVSACLLLLLSLGLLYALRLPRQLQQPASLSPWAGLQDIPTDQLLA